MLKVLTRFACYMLVVFVAFSISYKMTPDFYAMFDGGMILATFLVIGLMYFLASLVKEKPDKFRKYVESLRPASPGYRDPSWDRPYVVGVLVIVVLLLFGYMIWMVKDGSVSMVIDKPDERCGSEYIYDSALGACLSERIDGVGLNVLYVKMALQAVNMKEPFVDLAILNEAKCATCYQVSIYEKGNSHEPMGVNFKDGKIIEIKKGLRLE